MLSKMSNTFHGRDIFAPAAAYLANGALPAKFGPEIHKIVTPEFAKITRKGDTFIGEVMHIDNFGNIITNFKKSELEKTKTADSIIIKFKDAKTRLKLCKTYADVNLQESLAILGSHDFLEISVNQGNAANRFRVKIGDTVALCRS
jgi:S-adenosylmethionine hydrolase